MTLILLIVIFLVLSFPFFSFFFDNREPATESEAIPIRQSTTDLPKQTPPHTPDVPLISNSPLLSSRENSLSPVGEQNGPPPQHTMTTLLQSEKDASSSSFFSGREFLPPGSTMSAAPPPPGLSSTNILPSVFNGEYWEYRNLLDLILQLNHI